jgi:molecular chaperone DnaJ
MDYRDYYAILGVSRTATQAEVKKAYRKLARQHHPDVNKGNAAAETRFKEINEANAVLGDVEKRKAYDQLGSNWNAYRQAAGAGMPFEEFLRQAQAGSPGGFRAGGFPGGSSAGGFPGGIRFEYQGAAEDLGDFSDFFRTIFGNGYAEAGGFPTAGSARATMNGQRGGRRAGAGHAGAGHAGAGHAGAGYADPAAFGAGAGPGISLESLLGSLGGAGHRGRGSPGSAGGARPGSSGGLRHGDVEVEAEVALDEVARGASRLVQVGDRRLEVKIPAGVADGQRIRFSGKAGSRASSDGPAGDLYVRVKVAPQPVFERKGADLSREVSVTLREALLGGEVPVESVTGNQLLLTVPPGTQNGRVFRLAGQGLPRFRAEGKGDLRVRVRVVLPTSLGAGELELAERFLDAVNQADPRGPGRTPDPRRATGVTGRA